MSASAAAADDRSTSRAEGRCAAGAQPALSRLSRVRILLVSQMYPGPDAPDLGSFVATLERALEARGHEIARAVVDRPGGRAATPGSRSTCCRPRGGSARTSSTRTSSFPRGCSPLSAAGPRSSSPRTGRTSRTRAGAGPSGPRRALTVRRAAAVVAVSAWLLDRLAEVVPEALPKSIRDRLRRRPRPVRRPRRARRPVGGRLVARRHGVPLRRLAQRAQERAAPGARVRAAGRGRARVRRRRAAAAGARGSPGDPRSPAPSTTSASRRGSPPPTWSASRASREPFGLSTLEGLAVRPVGRRDPRRRPTRVRASGSGRPRRPPRRRCGRAPRSTRLPCCRGRTSPPGGRPRRTTSGGRRNGWRSFCFEPLEIGEPELDERPRRPPRARRPGRLRAPRGSSRAPSRAPHPA